MTAIVSIVENMRTKLTREFFMKQSSRKRRYGKEKNEFYVRIKTQISNNNGRL